MSPATAPQPANPGNFQGSIVDEKATDTILPLSLDDAIQRGLRHNLGVVLSSANARTAAGERLQQLQGLLPTVNGTAREAVQQTDLQAQGLRIPGFPAIIGPYGYTDIRGSLELVADQRFIPAELPRGEALFSVGQAFPR